ncbi:MAG: hypothetical protein ACXVJ1_14945, partial [Candidatus Angelobacter sp.]
FDSPGRGVERMQTAATRTPHCLIDQEYRGAGPAISAWRARIRHETRIVPAYPSVPDLFLFRTEKHI